MCAHMLDQSVCNMACGYETSHNAIKTWLYKTITSPITKTSEQNIQLKIYNVSNAFLIKPSSIFQSLLHVDNLNIRYLNKKIQH